MDENNRLKISVGKGRYEYVTYDDIFNDSDSGRDYCSDDDEDFDASMTNIDENFINNIIVDDPEQFETNTVNGHTDNHPDPDDELFRLLKNFDDICSDPNVNETSQNDNIDQSDGGNPTRNDDTRTTVRKLRSRAKPSPSPLSNISPKPSTSSGHTVSVEEMSTPVSSGRQRKSRCILRSEGSPPPPLNRVSDLQTIRLQNKSRQKQSAKSAQEYRNKMSDIEWREGKFVQIQESMYAFKDYESISVWPDEIIDLKTPYEYFRYFFTDKLLQKIIEETNTYAFQKGKNFVLTQSRLLKYFGILVLHTVTPCRNFRMHWNPNVGNCIIKDTLTVNEFEKIRENLHFNDNSSQKHFGEPGFDKLHKLRPVIDELRERFRSIPLEENLSLDEQMCPTKARHHMRQYLPAKPKKHGFKFYVLCGASGYGYDFELYTRQDSEILNNEDDLGASSNVVIRLTRSIPRHKNYKLFCDNYYTSMPLFHCLYEKGILAVGTIRSNRIINNPMPQKSNKNPRGHMEEYIASYETCPFIYARWKVNRDVTLLSTYVGQEPTLTGKRYNRSSREHDFVSVPQIIKCYNLHMGGVDLLDSVIGRARIIMRSRKWYMRIFYHLLDFAICNAWFVHNKRNESKLCLLEFRINLGTALCKLGQGQPRRAGRPSTMHCRVKSQLIL